ncbi:hypothetical protein GE061_007779 [Apolygus lucorum]|uniref:Uncharacterized protein n=1 Tax=Apolygus lucorum TaxID=248454 RepID=A0A6A4IXZ2_APOLU|nr:hypothetical protein GE061_007779 [Apolygus lucorum]
MMRADCGPILGKHQVSSDQVFEMLKSAFNGGELTDDEGANDDASSDVTLMSPNYRGHSPHPLSRTSRRSSTREGDISIDRPQTNLPSPMKKSRGESSTALLPSLTTVASPALSRRKVAVSDDFSVFLVRGKLYSLLYPPNRSSEYPHQAAVIQNLVQDYIQDKLRVMHKNNNHVSLLVTIREIGDIFVSGSRRYGGGDNHHPLEALVNVVSPFFDACRDKCVGPLPGFSLDPSVELTDNFIDACLTLANCESYNEFQSVFKTLTTCYSKYVLHYAIDSSS